MRLDCELDTKALKAKTQAAQKNLAYSAAQAINETVKEIQTEERVNLDRKFKIRKAGFMYRLVKVFAFASPKQGRPYAEVGIDDKEKHVILGLFEQGDVKQPAIGKNVAVPLTGEAARPSWGEPVPDAMSFRGLKFKKSAGGSMKGLMRTYLVKGVGVFQQVAGAAKSVLIYAFERPMKDGQETRVHPYCKQGLH
jgi:hypothetical protein